MTCGAFRLFPFQVEGARSLERANGRMAIFDEMGLGKTIQPMAYIHYNTERTLPIVALVKSGIKYQWSQAFITWLGDKYFAQVIKSSKEQFIPGLKVYIISYDILRRLNTAQLDRLIKVIKPKTLILDECQLIKNPDSSRTQEVRKLAKEIPNIIPLSGTPWKNRGSEFFTVLNMLAPSRFWSFEAFKRNWVSYYWDGNKQKEGGIRNPDKFKEFISDIAIRRERSQVMPELPTISRSKLIAELPESAQKAYDVAEDKLVNEWNDFVISGEEDSMAAHQKLMENLMAMRQIIGLAKVPATVEFAQEFLEDTDRKLVIFVHHKQCGQLIFDQLHDYCVENKLPVPLRLTADMSSEERYDVQLKFNGPNYRLLIASTLASGEGLNLQSCSDCVMHERQFNPANEEQAEGRFIRIGQTANAVNATYVHGNDTCDVILDSLVEKKRIQFHNAMNNGMMPVWNEGSLVKEIASIISKNRKK